MVGVKEDWHPRSPFDLFLAKQAAKPADFRKGLITCKDADDLALPRFA
jgi:hypothetical protein